MIVACVYWVLKAGILVVTGTNATLEFCQHVLNARTRHEFLNPRI